MIYEFVGPTAAPFNRTPSLRAFPARYVVLNPRVEQIAPYFTLKSQKGPPQVPLEPLQNITDRYDYGEWILSLPLFLLVSV